MKRTFATYEHSRIGFPHVVLKWHEDNGKWISGYIVIKGIIESYPWRWHNPHPEPFAEFEMKRFDDWVVTRFGNDASVQG